MCLTRCNVIPKVTDKNHIIDILPCKTLVVWVSEWMERVNGASEWSVWVKGEHVNGVSVWVSEGWTCEWEIRWERENNESLTQPSKPHPHCIPHWKLNKHTSTVPSNPLSYWQYMRSLLSWHTGGDNYNDHYILHTHRNNHSETVNRVHNHYNTTSTNTLCLVEANYFRHFMCTTLCLRKVHYNIQDAMHFSLSALVTGQGVMVTIAWSVVHSHIRVHQRI